MFVSFKSLLLSENIFENISRSLFCFHVEL